MDALISGDKILSFFHIDNAKGSRADPWFDDRRNWNFVREMVEALHHVGCRAALNHVGFRAKALNLAWFRGGGKIECLGYLDPVGFCKPDEIPLIPDKFDLFKIRNKKVSILGDFRPVSCR